MSRTSSAAPTGLDRRRVLSLFAAGTAAVTATACTAHSGSVDRPASGGFPADATELVGDVAGHRTKLILLGTSAGPLVVPGRSGMSSVVMVGDRPYVVDAGPWSSRKLGLAGISSADLGGVFVTHTHNDHIADLFNMFWLPGVTPTYVFRKPVPIYGPGKAGGLPRPYEGRPIPIQSPDHPTPSLREMIDGVRRAYAYEINIRNTELASQADFERFITVHDVLPPSSSGASFDRPAPDMVPFRVFEDDRVEVTAVLVPHGPVFPSYAFRFETEDGSITFSGDTAKSDNVVRLAQGTDILVHETINVDYYARTMGSPELVAHMEETHTSPADVGRVARAAGAKKVVLSHIGPGDPREVSDDVWEKGVRGTFAGEIVVGHDLMQMGVGAKTA